MCCLYASDICIHEASITIHSGYELLFVNFVCVCRILACIHLAARDVVVLENFYKYLAISDSLWSRNTMLLCLHFNGTCNNAFISLSRHKRVQLGLKESQMVYWWFWSISGVCIMGNQYTNTPLRYTSKLVSHPIIQWHTYELTRTFFERGIVPLALIALLCT